LYATGHTTIDWAQRKSLGRNNVAKWLHGFYSSHEQPYAYKVETLQRLCGSTATLREFRRLLRESLERLVELGTITRWEIETSTDLVSVIKPKAKQIKGNSWA
jgi:hypothetical protein